MAMPGTPVERGYHIADLSPRFVQQHIKKGGPYEGSNFRSRGVSLGPKQVISSKHLIVIISGENKRELTKQLFSYTLFDPAFPLSIIFHPALSERVQVYLTREVVDS